MEQHTVDDASNDLWPCVRKLFQPPLFSELHGHHQLKEEAGGPGHVCDRHSHSQLRPHPHPSGQRWYCRNCIWSCRAVWWKTQILAGCCHSSRDCWRALYLYGSLHCLLDRCAKDHWGHREENALLYKGVTVFRGRLCPVTLKVVSSVLVLVIIDLK